MPVHYLYGGSTASYAVYGQSDFVTVDPSEAWAEGTKVRTYLLYVCVTVDKIYKLITIELLCVMVVNDKIGHGNNDNNRLIAITAVVKKEISSLKKKINKILYSFLLQVVTIYGSGVIMKFKSAESLYQVIHTHTHMFLVTLFLLLLPFCRLSILFILHLLPRLPSHPLPSPSSFLSILFLRPLTLLLHLTSHPPSSSPTSHSFSTIGPTSQVQLPFGVGYLVPSAILGAEELSSQALHVRCRT